MLTPTLMRIATKSLQAFGLALASFAMLTGAALAETSAQLSLIQMNATEGLIYGEKAPVYFFTSSAGLSIGVYSQACGMTAQEISTRLAQIDALLSPFSSAERALSKLDPSLNEKLLPWMQKNKITVLITSLGKGKEIYSSFFIHQMPGLSTPTIVLDCSTELRSYWGPSLAHELAHAWLYLRSQDDFPPWLDEMVAQLVENEAQGARPESALSRFRNALEQHQAQPLTLWDTSRPLSGSDSYSLSYLFGKYLLSRWGGWETLRAMLTATPPVNHLKDRLMARLDDDEFSSWCAEYWERMTDAARQSLQVRGFNPSLIEKVTPRGLLRFFAVAIILHSESNPVYSIPGWPRIEKRIATPIPDLRLLKSGQFWFAPIEQSFGDFPVEKYEIHYSNAHFRINSLGAPAEANPSGTPWPFKLILVVNTN